MEDPINAILEISTSYAVPSCLHVIAEIGVADALREDPRKATRKLFAGRTASRHWMLPGTSLPWGQEPV
jgi:hypothetical protein